MAKLHFRYGVMGSSKTAEALMLAYNFKERGRKTLLAKPSKDTRTKKIWSRIGIEADCITLESLCEMGLVELSKYDCIVIDEAQFATKDQVDFLGSVADIAGVPVFAYGLRTDYRSNLFEGSKRLFEIADKIEEIQTSCWCGEAAEMNAMIVDGEVLKDKVKGSKEDDAFPKAEYTSLCRKHYNEGRIRA